MNRAGQVAGENCFLLDFPPFYGGTDMEQHLMTQLEDPDALPQPLQDHTGPVQWVAVTKKQDGVSVLQARSATSDIYDSMAARLVEG